jgi:NADH-ubiquinone oxidoreductase chain 5
LVTAGVFLLWRFYPCLVDYSYFTILLLYSGVFTRVLAGFRALFENDLKKIIALSTLSQLGIIFTGLGLSHPNLAFFHLLTHALFKALLFICAGNLIHCCLGQQDIRGIGGI